MNTMANFEKNLELLNRNLLNTDITQKIRDTGCASYRFCQTQKGELNLFKQIENTPFYFHSQEGAIDEATHWFKKTSNTTDFCQTLFLYGIGLGYYYDAIKPWLQKSSDHILVILEDDFSAIHRFLETSKAFEILSDPQVLFKVFPKPGESDWGNFRKEFDWMFWTFANRKCQYIAIQPYCNDALVQRVLTQISMGVQDRLGLLYETFGRAKQETVPNFYVNLLELPNSYFGADLFKEFSNLPTIICGAGPSLAKQFSLLKELGDRAVIFGAGSAMNALTRNGIEPHFGGGLDPTPTQKSRIMTNFAFEIPYFYTSRFYHEALDEVHGPHLYVDLNEDPSRWYENAFKLSDNPSFEIRNSRSTTQFCLDIARHLGCSPAIFVGLDLAYTDSKRYAPGVTTHQTDNEKEKKMIDHKEMTFKIRDVNGNEIYTNWTWILEAGEYAEFAREHNYPLINATEGGLVIVNAPNRSLKEVMQSDLQRSYDIPNLIHAAIQSSSFSKFSDQQIREKIEKWKETLEACSALCDLLIKELAVHQSLDNDRVKIAEKQLQELPFFKTSFTKIIEIIDLGLGLDYYQAKINQGQNSYKVLAKRYVCLKEILAFHLSAISTSLENFKTFQGDTNKKSVEDIGDEEIVEFSKESRYPFYYSTGELKGESFYLGNVLHGPSTFYAKNGKLLAKTWFVKGKREGKTRQYYLSGQLYSIQRFQEGKKHGKQEYYYRNGSLKSLLEYIHGELDGKVILFHPNGQKKKEYNFSKGTPIL